MTVTQEEKAQEVLERLFYVPRNRRTGLSEKFLRSYAGKKWADKDVRLSQDALIAEAERQVQNGALKKFRRGRGYPCFYRPRK